VAVERQVMALMVGLVEAHQPKQMVELAIHQPHRRLREIMGVMVQTQTHLLAVGVEQVLQDKRLLAQAHLEMGAQDKPHLSLVLA